MVVYIMIDENNRVIGWSSNQEAGSIEVDLPEDSEILRNPFVFIYQDGQFVRDDAQLIEELKKGKDAELNQACQDAIMKGFDYTVNGVSYHFSFDIEAQLNFETDRYILFNDIQESVMKTVINNETGEYERISINKDLMSELIVAALNHKHSCISKYRDELYPMLMAATTIEEINAISWDSSGSGSET